MLSGKGWEAYDSNQVLKNVRSFTHHSIFFNATLTFGIKHRPEDANNGTCFYL